MTPDIHIWIRLHTMYVCLLENTLFETFFKTSKVYYSKPTVYKK